MESKLEFGLFLLAVVVLSFVAGALVILSKTFPYEPLRNAYRAAEAVIVQARHYDDPLQTDLWREARTAERGVTRHDPDRAFEGYTLYTAGDGPRARLVAMDGSVVREWYKPFAEVWNETAAVKNPQPEELTYFFKARLQPNGDLFALYSAVSDTPFGYGLVKLDPESRVVWSYLEHAHHDFDVLPDGKVLVLTHAFTNEAIDHFDSLERPRLDDYAVLLSPEGRELKRISLTHALARSRYKALLHSTPYFALADPLHANAIEMIRPAAAARFPFGEAGQILLSFREPGMLVVLDPDSGEIVWATRGPWLGQHDPSLLENGHILLFDNLGHFQQDNASQILELDPASLGAVWRYVDEPGRPFESALRASVERLANGNTLITESDGGRLFEVTPGGETVWEYRNPVRAGPGDRFIPIVSWGQRVDPAALEADFRASLPPPAGAAPR